MSNKSLIYIAGPTSVGKTKLSLELAKKINTDIISCDSRQFYKEMRIGTGIPSYGELSEVNHHFIHHKSIKDIYTVGDFEKDAIKKLGKLFRTKNTIIMVGGSGMYADAVMFGLDKFPAIPTQIRNQINIFYQKHGLKSLQKLLLEKDPKYYTRVDINNAKRLIRALEVCITSNKPYSSFLGKQKNKRNFTSKMIFLNCPRNILYDKINNRVDFMIKSGLELEVKNLLEYRDLSPLKTFGYKELFPYFDGTTSIKKAVDEIKKNTRRYAKRQITWFKKYDNAILLKPSISADEIYNLLNNN